MSFGNEIFVGNFSVSRYSQLTTSAELLSEDHCIDSEGSAFSTGVIQEFRWSSDGRSLAWVEDEADFSMQNQIRQVIKLYDITTCTLSRVSLLDEFPGIGMNLDAYTRNAAIPAFDWDGSNLFVFNTQVTADGWGDLYIYSTETHKSSTLNPIGGRCCYRDARWSPDGLYLFFAFQNNDGKEQASTQFYYVPVSNIGTGQEFTPIALPGDFFIVSGEAPQPALHRSEP
jgi:Tol biopolymer transport system component